MKDVKTGTSDAAFGIGERIGRAANEMGLSLRQLASDVGVPYRTLQRYVGGGTIPATTLAKVVEHLGVSGDWVLTGKGPSTGASASDAERAFREIAAVVDGARMAKHEDAATAMADILIQASDAIGTWTAMDAFFKRVRELAEPRGMWSPFLERYHRLAVRCAEGEAEEGAAREEAARLQEAAARRRASHQGVPSQR